ncbi:small T antigen [Sea otter polyomavirus 1]|uniref:Small T antigen n=1 Tax=Sea otter polyomavirus 1 TaxID=1552409 RepID=A0A097A5H2_9POLY|nr:small T antigen [Sea otter polyomavirus 1]AIS40924.1 small T antigen [Sea otter polyomavirus 1]
MDTVLSREDARELMGLLRLDMAVYGNLPLMRKAYLKRCKELHPDKGGDETMMKKLNELYKLMEDNIREVHSNVEAAGWKAEEVGDDCYPSFENVFVKDWHLCSNYMVSSCYCMMCLLKGRHIIRAFERKLNRTRPGRPLVWIDCYCFDCYRLWFGLDLSWATFTAWNTILINTPLKHLKL